MKQRALEKLFPDETNPMQKRFNLEGAVPSHYTPAAKRSKIARFMNKQNHVLGHEQTLFTATNPPPDDANHR